MPFVNLHSLILLNLEKEFSVNRFIASALFLTLVCPLANAASRVTVFSSRSSMGVCDSVLLSQAELFDEEFGTLKMRSEMVEDATLRAQSICYKAGYRLCVKIGESVVAESRVRCASGIIGANMQVVVRGYNTI